MHGCSQVTVADRVAACQLSCDSWLGYEFFVFVRVCVCPIYEKNHDTGLSHLHEQINQMYAASVHILVDKQVLVKPR